MELVRTPARRLSYNWSAERKRLMTREPSPPGSHYRRDAINCQSAFHNSSAPSFCMQVFCVVSPPSLAKPEPRSRWRVIFRCLALATVLLLEVLVLTIRFDSGVFERDKQWWAVLLGE